MFAPGVGVKGGCGMFYQKNLGDEPKEVDDFKEPDDRNCLEFERQGFVPDHVRITDGVGTALCITAIIATVVWAVFF